jgi:hypothetical protein
MFRLVLDEMVQHPLGRRVISFQMACGRRNSLQQLYHQSDDSERPLLRMTSTSHESVVVTITTATATRTVASQARLKIVTWPWQMPIRLPLLSNDKRQVKSVFMLHTAPETGAKGAALAAGLPNHRLAQRSL